MNTFVFTKNAKKSFSGLNKVSRERILTKLKELKEHPDIFSILKRLFYFKSATHRLRVGSYRVTLKLEQLSKGNMEFIVVDIGHRKNIYKA